MPVQQIQPDEAARFHTLVEQWDQDTSFLSSTTAIIDHPAYQEIIRMGLPVVPLILQELEAATGHWFHALQMLTGEDPVPPEDAGDMEKMRQEWLAWGRAHGLI